ncbi:hypothetical protein HK098_008271, partial [Nowakowskiella sp. JEL0407]
MLRLRHIEQDRARKKLENKGNKLPFTPNEVEAKKLMRAIQSDAPMPCSTPESGCIEISESLLIKNNVPCWKEMTEAEAYATLLQRSRIRLIGCDIAKLDGIEITNNVTHLFLQN